MTNRCTWSDLPEDQCDHCGAHPGSTIVLEPPRAMTPTVTAAALRQPRHLPVLGSGDYGHEPDFQDMVDELTRAHTHRERYNQDRAGENWNGHHVTEVPSLVHQLLGATPSSSGTEHGSAPVSKPNARIEAIDTLMLIDDEAERWLARLGADVPGDQIDPRTDRPIPGSGTIAALRRAASHHRSVNHCGRERPHYPTGNTGRPDCCHRHQLHHDVRRWWRQARVISGWDSPAWRPRNTCPVCEQTQSLRINLVEQTGLCIECRSIWGPDEIGVLAEWIRAENAEDDEQQSEAS